METTSESHGPNGSPEPAGTGITSLPSHFVLHVCPIMPSQLSTELKRYLGQLGLSADLSGPRCTVVECSTYTESPLIERLVISSVAYSGESCSGDTGVPKWYRSTPPPKLPNM